MTLNELIQKLQDLGMPNFAKKTVIVSIVNEALIQIHTTLDICSEQAIIFVPEGRNTFRISKDDPNVIMATYAKINKCGLDGATNKQEYLKTLVEYDKRLKADILASGENLSDEIFDEFKDEVLMLNSVEGQKDKYGNSVPYSINVENVFAIDPFTLHFPYVKAGDVLYVTYKPKPRAVSLDKLDEQIDLPDTLLDVLYAFINLRNITNVEGYKQFYPQLLQNYNNELQKVINNHTLLPQGVVVDDMRMYKGFI